MAGVFWGEGGRGGGIFGGTWGLGGRWGWGFLGGGWAGGMCGGGWGTGGGEAGVRGCVRVDFCFV